MSAKELHCPSTPVTNADGAPLSSWTHTHLYLGNYLVDPQWYRVCLNCFNYSRNSPSNFEKMIRELDQKKTPELGGNR